jgi:hypothetical protein
MDSGNANADSCSEDFVTEKPGGKYRVLFQ